MIHVTLTLNLSEDPYLWVLSGHRAQSALSSFDFSEGAYRRSQVESPELFNIESACWTGLILIMTVLRNSSRLIIRTAVAE